MGEEDKTRSGRKQATSQEGDTVAGAYTGETVASAHAGETPPPATSQAGAAPPSGPLPGPPPTPPPLKGIAVRAAAEYAQIAGELAVASTSSGELQGLQDTCGGFWCLPDVNCSARDFTDRVQDAFDDNRRNCQPSA